MIYQFICQHIDEHAVQLLCKVFGVSRSGFYRYQAGETYQPTEGKKKLTQSVEESFLDHCQRYGSRRLVEELRDQGYQVSRYQVQQLMQQQGLRAIQPRIFVPRTTDSRHDGPFSPNLLLEAPLPTAPGLVLVGEITYIALAGGEWAYLAAWMDLFSRRIKGWQVEKHMEASLIHKALKKALVAYPIQEQAIVHSDRGGQYIDKGFRLTLKDNQLRQSMSRPDDPYDNAFMESYWSRLKAELIQDGIFQNLEDARTELFEYIECYYNRKRKHSSLGYLSPEQFENEYYLNLSKTKH
ncbi:IS3 family transposase [Spirosoma flavum]|uniref:IS3 family transposase n=1 Tax=Spirosoma flavum TaxID=2048557 RepID=A0ABW6ATJ8_9BACT